MHYTKSGGLQIIAGHSTYAHNYWLQAFDNLNVLMILNAVINPFIYGVFTGPTPACLLASTTSIPPDAI